MPACTEEKCADRIIVHLDAQHVEMAPHFLHYRRNEIRQLQEAVQHANLEQVRITGHNMKGIGRTYKVAYISRIGKLLMNAASKGDWSQIKRCISQLEDKLHRLHIVCAEPE